MANWPGKKNQSKSISGIGQFPESTRDIDDVGITVHTAPIAAANNNVSSGTLFSRAR